ncbi:MAG: hypothetical protein BWZ03_00135 [bacterium ADurb.BinA186]|nr:MAG: hypothetical protein BWZ03_00135 [bacterium ADurb.BinA186]
MKKKKNKSLYQNPNYKAFTQKRDVVLEKILRTTQKKITDATSHAFNDIQAQALRLSISSQGSLAAVKMTVKNFDREIDNIFLSLALHIMSLGQRLLDITYKFSIVSEAEAIARAGVKASYKVNPLPPVFNSKPILYGLNKLKYALLKEMELGLINEESAKEISDRITAKLPKIQRYKRPPRILKKPASVKEAIAKPKFDAAPGFITDQDWDKIVSAYKEEYIPKFRGPEAVYDLADIDGGADAEEWYGWEIEKQLNQEFVQQVRDGQNVAANQNGFTDMVWIAIIDDRTDECCAWRDGLTTSEIQARLDEMGGEDEEGCDATIPPAHFNCRCTLAPYSEDIDTVPQTDFKDFDSWLNDQ